MGIEQNIERIAAALEKLVTLNEGTLEQRVRITRCAEFNAARNGMNVEPAFAELQAKEEEAVIVDNDTPAAEAIAAAEVSAEPEWTYDTLKAALIERGVEIAKGTKMTTLLKLWEQHKNDAPAGEEEGGTDEAGATELADDIFGEAPAAPAKEEFAIPCDLAPEKAREIIARYYDRSEEDKNRLLKSLQFVDPECTTFLNIPQGKHGVVAARFLELKGVKVADICGDNQ
jgi:hypothetical protein